MSVYDRTHREILAFIRENGRRPSEAEIRARLRAVGEPGAASAADPADGMNEHELDRTLQTLVEKRLLRPEIHDAVDAGKAGESENNAAQGPDLRREIPDVLPDDDDLEGDDEDSSKISDFNRQWDRILEPSRAETLPDWVVDAYTSQVREIADRSVRKTYRDTALYAGVNAGLLGVWWISGAGYPWFVFPLFGWGIGIASQVGATLRRRRHAEEVSLFQRPAPPQLSQLRRLRKVREDFGASATGSIAVMAGLVAFNAVTSPFPWSIFPIAALGAGVVSKAIGFRSHLAERKKKLSDAGFRLPSRKERRARRRGVAALDTTSMASGGSDVVSSRGVFAEEGGTATARARGLAVAIESDLMRIADSSRVRDDIYPDVRDCVEQIATLEHKRAMISRLLSEVSREQLSQQRSTLESDMAACEDETLRTEYERSIGQLSRQQQSLSRLEREREIMRLRIQSALGALQQMRLELARLTHIERSDEVSSASNLEARAGELTAYIRDVASAYDELEGEGRAPV